MKESVLNYQMIPSQLGNGFLPRRRGRSRTKVLAKKELRHGTGAAGYTLNISHHGVVDNVFRFEKRNVLLEMIDGEFAVI